MPNPQEEREAFKKMSYEEALAYVLEREGSQDHDTVKLEKMLEIKKAQSMTEHDRASFRNSEAVLQASIWTKWSTVVIALATIINLLIAFFKAP